MLHCKMHLGSIGKPLVRENFVKHGSLGPLFIRSRDGRRSEIWISDYYPHRHSLPDGSEKENWIFFFDRIGLPFCIIHDWYHALGEGSLGKK